MDSNISKTRLWTGYIISGLVTAFLLLDGIAKLFKPVPVVEATTQLGYPEITIIPIGITLIVCTIFYLIPKTSVLGAILLTGYLGGAVATHVRVNGGAFPIIFAVTFGILVWGGIYLRDGRLGELIPLRK